MNIKEYIVSGVLELYVAGALTEREMREVEHIASLYPEVKKELDEIESAMFNFTNDMHNGPKNDLKAAILNQAKLTSGMPYIPQHPVINETPTGDPIELQQEPLAEAKVISFNKRPYVTAIAACIILLIVSNAGVVVLWNNWKTTRSSLVELQESYKQSNLQLASLETSYRDTRRTMDVLRNPDYVKLKLAGQAISPSSEAVVHWNKNTKKVMIDMINMPPTDAAHDYQLWALVDGKPVDLGIFSASESGAKILEMKDIDHAQAFAVTLEPKGGSVNLTLEQLYLMGKI